MGASGSQTTATPNKPFFSSAMASLSDGSSNVRPIDPNIIANKVGGLGSSDLQPAPAPQPAAPAMVQPSGPNVFQQAQGYQTQAGKAYGGLAGFQAPTAQAAQIGPVQGVGPVGTLAGADMGQYMSPYTQQVIERGQADIARQREQAMNRLGAQASAAGAFGGSRQGVAEGVTMGEYGRMAGDFAAQQREKAYQQALGAAQYDIGQQQQRAMQDASMRQQAALQQANLQQQAALANQQAALSGAGIQQAGAAGLGGLAGQAFGMGQSVQQAVSQQAMQQRLLEQQILDAQRAQYQTQVGAPLAGLGLTTSVLAGLPSNVTKTSSYQPGLLDYMMAASKMIPGG